MSKSLEWIFTTYPKTYDDGLSEQVLCKTTKNVLVVCEWNGENWLVGDDILEDDVVCWSYVYGIPESNIPMNMSIRKRFLEN